MENTNNENIRRIVIWGIKGVGKTLMIKTLPRELELLSGVDTVKFKIKELEGNAKTTPRTLKEFPEPTSKYIYTIYEITVEDTNQKTLTTQLLSTFDDRGDAMRDALLNPDDSEFRLINQNIDTAFGIIALIEPEYLIKKEERQKTLDLLEELIRRIGGREKEIYIAICINKIDRLDLRWKNSEVIFEVLFGSGWRNLKSLIINYKNIKASFFVISAVGYYANSREETIPNYYAPEPNLVDEDIWRSWNVSAPFFWILKEIEIKQPNTFLSYLINPKGTTYPKPFF